MAWPGGSVLARARQAAWRSSPACPGRLHPRACGAVPVLLWLALGARASFPRSQGRRSVSRLVEPADRSIPACGAAAGFVARDARFSCRWLTVYAGRLALFVVDVPYTYRRSWRPAACSGPRASIGLAFALSRRSFSQSVALVARPVCLARLRRAVSGDRVGPYRSGPVRAQRPSAADLTVCCFGPWTRTVAAVRAESETGLSAPEDWSISTSRLRCRIALPLARPYKQGCLRVSPGLRSGASARCRRRATSASGPTLVEQHLHSVLVSSSRSDRKSSTDFICFSFAAGNTFRNSGIVSPDDRFMNRACTGSRVPLKHHAPVILFGSRSISGHSLQSISPRSCFRGGVFRTVSFAVTLIDTGRFP